MMIYYHDSVPHIADLYRKVQEHQKEMLPDEHFPPELMDLFHEEFAPALSDLFMQPDKDDRKHSNLRTQIEHLLDRLFDGDHEDEEKARKKRADGATDQEPKTLANFWKRLDLSG